MVSVYSLNLEGGRKYVGMTTDVERRLSEHFSGRGSVATRQFAPVSVNHVQTCRSEHTAKRAEKIVYEKMRDYHGMDKVRGAGHTKRFEPCESRRLREIREHVSGAVGPDTSPITAMHAPV